MKNYELHVFILPSSFIIRCYCLIAIFIKTMRLSKTWGVGDENCSSIAVNRRKLKINESEFFRPQNF